jgi:hypothetical protein
MANVLLETAIGALPLETAKYRIAVARTTPAGTPPLLELFEPAAMLIERDT